MNGNGISSEAVSSVQFFRLLWGRFLGFDKELHGRLSRRYPKAIPTIDRWITAVVDRFLSNPVLAIVLAFIALILGVAGVRPLVLVSAGIGWFVCFLWAVRSRKLQELTVVARLSASLLVGTVLAFGFWGLGNWALVQHAKEEESSIPKTTPPSSSLSSPRSTKEPEEFPTAPNPPRSRPKQLKVSPPSQESLRPVQPTPPVMLAAAFVGPVSPAISVYNPSAEVIEGVLWEVVAFRTSDLCFFGFQTQKIDYIKPQSKSANMAMELATMPRNAEGCDGSIRDGDELTGSVSVDCSRCSIQTYVIHLTWKESGWYFESDLKGGFLVPKERTVEGRQKFIQLLTSDQFASRRIEIMPQ